MCVCPHVKKLTKGRRCPLRAEQKHYLRGNVSSASLKQLPKKLTSVRNDKHTCCLSNLLRLRGAILVGPKTDARQLTFLMGDILNGRLCVLLNGI